MPGARWWWVTCVLALACGGDDANASAATDGPGVVLDTGSGDGINLDDDGDETGDKLDVGQGGATAGGGDCSSGGGTAGGADFSLIWIANSPEGTVSKIDTQTGVELARYYSGPTEGDDDPSRTSVNLAGDVAVANRAGGITKIATREEHCVDLDGDGTITTSSGPDDLLAFGSDECVVWNIPLPGGGGANLQGPRPTAWDAGAGADPCDVDDDRLWVGWFDIDANAGHFYRLDGATGGLLDDVEIASWNTDTSSQYGPYGGATDGDGNMWVLGLSGPLARIDGASLQTDRWEVPEGTSPYGIALDADGHPWTTGLAGEITHFDPATQSFQVFQIGAQLRGVQIDRTGDLWAAVNGGTCGVMRFDTKSKTVVAPVIALDGCETPVGVSIDVDGFVWLPDQGADAAFKYDPVTGDVEATEGLRAPYTYSDMTGSGLGLVTYPPG